MIGKSLDGKKGDGSAGRPSAPAPPRFPQTAAAVPAAPPAKRPQATAAVATLAAAAATVRAWCSECYIPLWPQQRQEARGSHSHSRAEDRGGGRHGLRRGGARRVTCRCRGDCVGSAGAPWLLGGWSGAGMCGVRGRHEAQGTIRWRCRGGRAAAEASRGRKSTGPRGRSSRRFHLARSRNGSRRAS